MALFIINGNTAGFTLPADGDSLIIQPGGQVFNTTAVAVNAEFRFGTILNDGSIAGRGGIYIGNSSGSSRIVNTGSITSDLSGIIFSGAGGTIINSGSITGSNGIFSGNASGDVTLRNLGNIFSHRSSEFGSFYAYFGSASVDNVINSGSMVGNVFLYFGNDFYDGRAGTVTGTVDGSSGNDIIVGGSAADKLLDTSGSNWIVGGGGDDEVTIGNFGLGTTTAWAGEANFGTDNSLNDTLFVSGGAANIFLGGRVSDVATGAVAAWIWGFENATGTTNADSIIGTSGNNIIKSNGGVDWLVGNGGFDQLVFDNLSSSGSTISGFSADLIDLHNIDSNTSLADDQAFLFKTVHTSNAAGELVFTNFGGGGQVELYTNADNTVDATIFISYAAGSSAPTASDFWL